MSPLLLIAYLLATGNDSSRRSRSPVKSRAAQSSSSSRGRCDLGRNRYTRDGIKRKPPSDAEETKRQEELYLLPDLTFPEGPRPLYYTCRHGYETTLIGEIQKFALKRATGGNVVATSPYPGLVKVVDDGGTLPKMYDPVYALQCMPECVVVSAESIKGIAREVLSALLGSDEIQDAPDERIQQSRQHLLAAPKGSLTIHSLVPGMCKGQTNPIMQRRSTKIGEELSQMLKKSFAAARKAPADDNANTTQPQERWLLQIMLQSPSIAVASLTKCQSIGPGKNACWPNCIHPLGLVKVDIEERMPSSAYRKLMEGIECMGIRPTDTTTIVDLGACPGGWTSVMRRYFNCRVIAVDRSELDPVLMKDPMVTFVKGDAFTYEPPLNNGADYWMISDVIAYPERATELLSQWCKNKLALNMIVTMKFQGDEPDLDELNHAMEVVSSLGFQCRVKHFFNNKNEVTFMVSRNDTAEVSREDLKRDDLGRSLYKSM
ncbi:hypothetical protein ACHAWO_008965 [Cyclotella atomus]|uniref:Ribosomal RNA methyltransferase FtsJ domain-containing protein n=1 Tax=Cyclotella atomus TaxID=382360 RepID=A0ABD3NPM7_9STRA